jgi:hypothetical protein
MFTAGIAMVGVVHQTAWLAKSEQPLLGEHLNPRHVSDVRNNLRMIAVQMTSMDWPTESLPAASTWNDSGEALHSWETQILPFMSYVSADIDLEKPWNDLANQKYFKCIIPDFINLGFRPPPLEDAEGYGLNHFAANSHVILPDERQAVDELKNGASKTILLGEVNAEFSPWGRPLNVRDPNAGINRRPDGFGGPNGEGALFSMADGSGRFISNDIDPAVLSALSGAPKDDARPRED